MRRTRGGGPQTSSVSNMKTQPGRAPDGHKEDSMIRFLTNKSSGVYINPIVGHERPPYNLHIIKYVGWYMVFRISWGVLFFDLPLWVHESILKTPLAYNDTVSMILGFACVPLAACMTGGIFAGKYKRFPERYEARILSGVLVLLSLAIWASSRMLLMKLFADTGDRPEAQKTVEELFGKPRDMPQAFYLFYAFYLLFHYWLIGFFFVKGAMFWLRVLEKEKREKEKEA